MFLRPSSPAETLIQPQECFSTPISRKRASNSARLGEELRVRLDKARGGLEAQTEHELLKLDHTKRILQLKLEKESEILELGLHNERERNRVAVRHEEELHNIAVQNLHATRSHQDAVNQVTLEQAQLERELALRLLEQHPPRQ
uniref:Uncharacterized protein n=1 Tax=Timema douglasi TaxID=61478 RepID=A0A7R8VXN0_TIMDO|nr:unnamed protein product [Timema douglasi]